MKRLESLFNTLSNWFGILALACLLFLMFGTTADVVVRAITGRSISGVFEMAELSMVLLVFLGLGWTKRDNAHIRVTILLEKVPQHVRRILETVSWGMAALLLLLIAIPSSMDAMHSFEIREFRWGYIEFPIWWAKIALAIGLWFAFLQMTLQCLQTAITGELPEIDGGISPTKALH
ncbi:MAG TPA: TRAP transporter small permease [Candidimonas sp.]|nr:TRAP transporter small permease [Candidimonas sp.]